MTTVISTVIFKLQDVKLLFYPLAHFHPTLFRFQFMVLGQLGQDGTFVVNLVGMATNSEPEDVIILLQLTVATPVLDRAQKTACAS